MYITQWYGISIGIAAAWLIFQRVGSIICGFFVTQFQYSVLKHLVYPLLVNRRRHWKGVTRMQCLLVGGVFLVNGTCIGLNIKSTQDLIRRTGLMASMNMIPLFLGGRTSTVIDFLGISLQSYYLAHHWIGRIVVAQGLFHVCLVIASKQSRPFDTFQISGVIVRALALTLTLLFSLYFVRRVMYEAFLKLHSVLAFIVVVALLIHLLPMGLEISIFPIVAMGLWSISTFLRLFRLILLNVIGERNRYSPQASITHFGNNEEQSMANAIQVDVSLRKPLCIRPGQYVYLFMSDIGIRHQFQAHPYVIAWWDDSIKAKKLSFLIQPLDGVSLRLVTRNSIRNVIIDGPYGQDLQLENFETVVLIAKGIGIAGILPYIRHMTYRRVSKDKNLEAYRRGLITRKIDVFWVLEDNEQESWITEWIKELQEKDAGNLILSFSSFYPTERRKDPPASTTSHWKSIYQKDPFSIIETLIEKQIQRSPGRTKIVVCGDPGFSHAIRQSALRCMSKCKDVNFAEAEFQPNTYRKTMVRKDDKQGDVPKRPYRKPRPRMRSGKAPELDTVSEVDELELDERQAVVARDIV